MVASVRVYQYGVLLRDYQFLRIAITGRAMKPLPVKLHLTEVLL
jgi:hypothetical protein